MRAPEADTNVPLVLGIETATSVCGVALADGAGLKGEVVMDAGLSHSSKLVELVRRVLEDASTDLSRIDALAVSVGPGSFTGVRIGIGTVLGLASGAGLPVVPVPTLDALAWAQRPFRGLVCAFVDARRGEVYYCLYDVSWDRVKRLADYSVRSPKAMWADIGKMLGDRPEGTELLLAGPQALLGPALAGPVFERAQEDKISKKAQVPVPSSGEKNSRAGAAHVLVTSPERAAPRPAAVAALGVELCREGKAGAIDDVKPIYVRRSDAELRRKTKTGTP